MVAASFGLGRGASFQHQNRVKTSSSLWKAVVEGQASSLARWTLGPLLTTLTYPYAWAHLLRLQAYRLRWAAVRRHPRRRAESWLRWKGPVRRYGGLGWEEMPCTPGGRWR